MNHYENKILSCESDIETLQAHIKELQKQKLQEELKNIKSTPEPNMKVMTEWLQDIQKYREYTDEINAPCPIITPANRRDMINMDIPGIFGTGRKDSSFSGYFKPQPNNRFLIKNFSPEQIFMENFVKSTHNLFQILQKRIEYLEQKL